MRDALGAEPDQVYLTEHTEYAAEGESLRRDLIDAKYACAGQ